MVKVSDIFQCTRCGYCCHGEATVSLDSIDQQRMVDELGGGRNEVCKKYWQVAAPIKPEGKSIVQMKITNGHCIFYCKDKNGLGGCAVHQARPWRCGQWPLHPAILGDENNFITIRESCPGLNRNVSYQEFCAVLRDLMEQGVIQC